MTPVNLTELNKKAKAATLGPWGYVMHGYADLVEFQPGDYVEVTLADNAEYIAAAKPATILTLIAALTEVREALTHLTDGGDKLRECCRKAVQNEEIGNHDVDVADAALTRLSTLVDFGELK